MSIGLMWMGEESKLKFQRDLEGHCLLLWTLEGHCLLSKKLQGKFIVFSQ